ncbi:MAG: DUF2834 domain-containing protein [Pseudoruegeria sp.]
MSKLRYIYLGLAFIGAYPMLFFIRWFEEFGYSLTGMVTAWHANDASSGLVWDLTISAIALTLWVLAETFQNKTYRGLWAILATWCIGVSCGLPLYLFLRSRVDN